MSDNLNRYFVIHKALQQLRPSEPKGNVARHLNTLAFLIADLSAHRNVTYPLACCKRAIARKVPVGGKPQSRIQRMERWIANEAIDTKTYYLPYLLRVLDSLPQGPLVVIIDSSQAGRDCVLLSINVVYQFGVRRNCCELVTFFGFTPELRRLMYTTNVIESFHRQLRKSTKGKNVFPNDESLLKMLYLVTREVTRKWTVRVAHWGQILAQLSICFGERVEIGG